MALPTPEDRRSLDQLSRSALADYQSDQATTIAAAILPTNRFYREKLREWHARRHRSRISQPGRYAKSELLGDANDDLAKNHTFPIEKYVVSSHVGTRGRPMAVLDTVDDWQWWMHGWQFVLDAARMTAADRVLMAFSLGRFSVFGARLMPLSPAEHWPFPPGDEHARATRSRSFREGDRCFLYANVCAAHGGCCSRLCLELASLGVRRIVVAGRRGARFRPRASGSRRPGTRRSSITRGPPRLGHGAIRPSKRANRSACM